MAFINDRERLTFIDYSKLNTSSLNTDGWRHYPAHLEGSDAKLLATLLDNEGCGLVNLLSIWNSPLTKLFAYIIYAVATNEQGPMKTIITPRTGGEGMSDDVQSVCGLGSIHSLVLFVCFLGSQHTWFLEFWSIRLSLMRKLNNSESCDGMEQNCLHTLTVSFSVDVPCLWTTPGDSWLEPLCVWSSTIASSLLTAYQGLRGTRLWPRRVAWCQSLNTSLWLVRTRSDGVKNRDVFSLCWLTE